MATYKTNKFSKCPSCGFNLYNRGNNMGREMSEMLRARKQSTRKKINKIATIINDLIPSQNRTEYWKFLETIGKDSEAIRELERRRIGGVPPIIKIEERQ